MGSIPMQIIIIIIIIGRGILNELIHLPLRSSHSKYDLIAV
jgi:hypothetical protein